MAGDAFTNLNTISLSDNFRAWFDKTNEIVETLNPVAVYGITPGTGITIAINTNGIATVGLSLEDATTGDTDFTGSLTFSNEVRFTGLTLDVSGATLFGNVVRSINGLTGAVTIGLTGINDPTTATGDIIIKAASATFEAYSLFNGTNAGSSFSNMPFRFAASGGMLLGGQTGGSAGVHMFKNGPLGSLQIANEGGITLGSTISYLHLKNLGYTGSDVSEYGSQIFFGRVGGGVTNSVGLVFRGGGSTNGTDAFDTSGPNLVIDQTLRRFGLNGITAPLGTYHLITESSGATSVSDILLQNTGGSTIAIRTAIAGSTGEYVGLEGASSITTARLSGFQDKNRLRTVVKGSMPSVGIELRHDSTESTNFSVLGQESSGSSMSPVLTVVNDGTVSIGGINSTMFGSTFGSLNLVSGSLLLGGTAGSTIAETGGLLTLMSKGGTLTQKNIFADSPNGGSSTSVFTNVTFSGTITDDMVMDLRGTDRGGLEARNEDGVDISDGGDGDFDATNNDVTYLEFIEYDSSGNKRYAVGNFEIDITMPSYIFVNEQKSTQGDPTFGSLRSVIGAVALIDQDKLESFPTSINLRDTASNQRTVMFSPNTGKGMLHTDDLISGSPQQITLSLRGNCAEGVRVALITTKTHAVVGQRIGAIYRSPGSFSAKFFNVE